jgi:predicted nucleic acid-binding protein
VTRYYLDTSIAVHALQGTPAAERWFDTVTADLESEIVSSRILQTELTRFLRRVGAAVSDRDLILRHLGLVPVSESVLSAAEAVGDHVKTLDAIHVAQAVALGSRTVVVSHDVNVLRVAGLLGLAAHDPITN